MNKEIIKEKCKKLGETCYDFTQLWCDDCLQKKIKKALTSQQVEFRNMVRKLAKEYGETDETLHYSQALADILKQLK